MKVYTFTEMRNDLDKFKKLSQDKITQISNFSKIKGL